MGMVIFRSVDSKQIVIEKNYKQTGILKFEGFFNQRSYAINSNNETFEFKRQSIWKDTFELKQGDETFLACKMGMTGKIKISNPKTGKEFIISSKSWLNKKFEMTDDTGELLFRLTVKYGFLISIKSAEMETTAIFDEMKDQFLICAAVVFSINEQIKKTAVVT